MTVAFSTIGSKNRTVIPRKVRERLGLKPGNGLRYTITAIGVRIERAGRPQEEDRFTVFTEWASEEDEKAFRSL